MSTSHHSTGLLLGQVLGGLAWGIFLIVIPMELLFLGAIVWLPLFIYVERVQAERHGAWPGLFIRMGIIAAVVVGALMAPTKYEDQRVGPLAQVKVSLGDLAAEGLVYANEDLGLDAVQIMLPSTKPTIREVMQAIEQQTNLNARIFGCGNGATLLFGGGGGRISVMEKRILR